VTQSFTTTDENAGVALRRELGRWDLTAVGVNQVIGGAVFALPAALAANAGTWSPWLTILAGGASMLVALCFAEAASRFEGTGGPYLYTRAAFGRFAAFEVGWLLWFTRVTSWASVINILVASLGFYWSAMSQSGPRAAVITLIIAAIMAVNIRGIRQSSFVLNALTISKLTPLVIFIAFGLFAIDWSRLSGGRTPSLHELSTTALLLIYAFGGYEVVPVPAGEARDPRRGVPFALIMTILIATAVMTLVQFVALGTLPNLPASKTPLADAAALFLGAGGAALLTIGAICSTGGNNMGQALSGSRNLYALAEQGDLPPFFGRVHARFRTPVNAVVVTSLVSLVLAVSGTFAFMAAASAITRLLVYVATCASVLRLRDPRLSSSVGPATFVVPLGPSIPIAAILIAVAVLSGATATQLASVAAATLAGAVLYQIAVRGGASGTAAANNQLGVRTR
jgi:APA family basic amino acid/polyamine antiporter